LGGVISTGRKKREGHLHKRKVKYSGGPWYHQGKVWWGGKRVINLKPLSKKEKAPATKGPKEKD